MKFLKSVFLLVLCSLFLLSACAGAQPVPPKPDASPTTFYVKYDCWQSPFNPHEILKHWRVVTAELVGKNKVLLIVGNPKINWKEDYVTGTNPSDVPIPEGELASSMAFAFMKSPIGTTELLVYVYKDNFGIYNMYTLNVKEKCYEKAAEPKQQDSCYNNSYHF